MADDPQKVQANVTKIRAAGGTDADVDAYLGSIGAVDVTQPVHRTIKAPLRSAPMDEPGLAERIAGGLSAGLGILPGGQRLMAKVGELTGGGSYEDVLAEIEKAQTAAPWLLKRGMQAAGLVGSMAATPLKVLQGGRLAGAAFGGGLAAAQRGLSETTEPVAERLSSAAGAGVAGAGLGYVAPWLLANPVARTALGGLAGAAVSPEGTAPTLTGALAGATLSASPSTTAQIASRGIARIAPRVATTLSNIAEATGIRGTVNRENAAQQTILDALGTGQKVGQAQGSEKVRQMAKAIQSAESGANYGQALSEGVSAPPGSVHPAIAPMYKHPVVQRAAAQIKRLSDFQDLSLDDPKFVDELYKTLSDQKASLGNRIEGAESPVNFLRATKAEIQDAQNAVLDATDQFMPSYRKAVENHSSWSSWRRAFDLGRKAVTLKNPLVAEADMASQPQEVQDAFRLGAKYGISDQMAESPLDEGVVGVLRRKPFRVSATDEARRGVTGSPDLSTAVAEARGDLSPLQKARLYLPGTKGHIASAMLNSAMVQPMKREAATKLLSEVLRDPEAYQSILAKYRLGTAATNQIERALQGQIGNLSGMPFGQTAIQRGKSKIGIP